MLFHMDALGAALQDIARGEPLRVVRHDHGWRT
jgi:hypothetical protein